MKFDWTIALSMALVLCLGVAATLAMQMHLKGVEMLIFMALLALVGVAAAAAIVYFKNRNKAPKPAAAGAAAPAPGGDTEIDTLVREADQRLAHANAGATIANMPLIFVIGDRSTAKTSTVVNSGIEAELLAGQIYQDNMIGPTRAANLWFARGTALVEAGGAILGDPGNWMRLVKRLHPGKLKSLKGGAQSPRAVLLCVSLEAFTQGGVDAITAAARYLQARLAEVAQTLGIRFPVYILFTKTDRVPFFTEFVGTFNNEETTQVFGVTVPMLPAKQTGVYAEDETRRLTAYFDNLFYSLCDKRTVFPPRDNDIEKVCGAYEFPREIRKVRDIMVRFMVDVCRPSQLTTSPFLRGFYFSGVRPVIVTDAAPLIASRPQQAEYQSAGSTGATGMFRVGKQAEIKAQQSVAQPVAASRKVPQWMFLGHLFNNIILSDSAAMSASGSSVKVSALRRGLLIAASVICLILSGIFLWSWWGNRALENKAITAAQAIDSTPVPPGKSPSLASLQHLETLRQTLETLDGYESDGAPYHMRWGLYRGSDMYPEVRRLYFRKFKALLFGQTQANLLTYMQGVRSPAADSADFDYPYDTLKGYLLTTGKYNRDGQADDPVKLSGDKVLPAFLRDLLYARWSEKRDPKDVKELGDLAKRQFNYYAGILGNGNPYPDVKQDADTVKNARVYLASFRGAKRVYSAIRNAVAKKGKAQSFNQYYDASVSTVSSPYVVQFPFTKDGAAEMLAQIKNRNISGEQWVLGPYYAKPEDVPGMQKDLESLYSQDYIKEWHKVLNTSHVVPYKDYDDAATKLDTLTGSGAPLLEMLLWTSQNTAVPDLPDVKEAFRVVQQVEPPDKIAPVENVKQPYNDPLQNLQIAVANLAKNAKDPAALPASLSAAQAAATTATQATRNYSSTFPPDRTPDGHLEQVVLARLLEPITAAEPLFKSHDAEDLNRAGGGFCSSFGPITKKFPFDPRAGANMEATLPELAAVFSPKDGKLWALYEGGLKKAIVCKGSECTPLDKAPITISSAFLRFFNQAVKFSRALYGDSGTAPNYHYTLSLQKTDQIDSFDVTVNGDHAKLAGGAKKEFVWPGPGTQNFNITLNLAGGTSTGLQPREGLWSVFRFFADADTTTFNGTAYDFVWNPRSGKESSGLIIAGRPLSYTFTVDTNGAPAVFSKEFLAGMKCLPVGAK